MRKRIGMALPGLVAIGLVAAATAETKVEVKGVHLCCGQCVKGVGSALKKIEGVTPACNKEDKTVTITAPDDATAQKALDALGQAGYYGDTGNPNLVVKQEINLPAGKVQKLTISGIHNCCGACNKAVKGAVKSVDGVKGDTATAKSASFEVTGDFDGAAVIKALNAAGFHVEAK
jgi:periplasmic mercuric ion binding protein